MVRSIGARAVSVSAPKTFKPGVRSEVSVTLSAGGTETLGEVSVSLKAPGGLAGEALWGGGAVEGGAEDGGDGEICGDAAEVGGGAVRDAPWDGGSVRRGVLGCQNALCRPT